MDNINIEFCPYRLYSPFAFIFGVAGIFCIMLLGRFWERFDINICNHEKESCHPVSWFGT